MRRRTLLDPRLVRPRLRAASAAVAALVHDLTSVRERHQALLDAIRIVRDDDVSARAMLLAQRESVEYQQAYEEEPLVTVILTTYNNWPLLGERSLPSVLAQTYERWEAIVVGDAAPDDARRVVESFGDERLRFVNLPYRGPYPSKPNQAWLVSGTTPWNTGLSLARGRWIASNSDDDSLRPNYIESLLGHARREHAEVAYGYIHQVEPDSPGSELGVFPPGFGQWGMQGSLLHGCLRFMPLQPTDWMFGIPNDWSLAERMMRIGVRFSMLDEIVADYYPSAMWTDRLTRETF
jgi:glycosyltransferase involved in cell wall biosynthesis